jgi:hypothetical protein
VYSTKLAERLLTVFLRGEEPAGPS